MSACVGWTADGKAIYEKDPDASLPYGYDFTAWLDGGNFDQGACTVTVDPALTEGTLWFQPSGHFGVWLSGGETPANGEKIEYLVTLRGVTQDSPPRIEDASFVIRMKNK